MNPLIRYWKWYKPSGLSRAGNDDSGVTFVEVMVTFVMLVAAVVVTAQSLFFGNRALDVNMHKQQVLRIVQMELEYWIGNMYVHQRDNLNNPFPSDQDMQGSPTNPYKTVYIDDYPDSEIDSKIAVGLFYDKIEKRPTTTHFELGETYWVITVWAEWEEPDGQKFTQENENAVSLTSYSQRPY